MNGEFAESLPTRYDKLVIFDCDGVLAYQQGSWTTLHEAFETVDHQRKHRRRYLDGELNMVEWSKLTAEHWRGRSAATLEAAADEATPIPGFPRTLDALREHSFAVGVVSAGVLGYVEQVVGDAPVDFVLSNDIETADGELTGEIRVNVVDQNKVEWFRKLAESCDVPRSNVVLVGNASHDLTKIHPGNLSIAFNPQDDRVRQHADSVVDGDDLRSILGPIRRWLEQTGPLEGASGSTDEANSKY